MADIGIVVHPERDGAATLARDLIDWLTDRGHEVRLPAGSAAALGHAALAVPDDELAIGADLLVGLGGDGTMLRASRLAAADDVPVLGVNAGQLGYLTTIEPSGARVALKRFLAGSYDVERRMRLAVEVVRVDGSVESVPSALNEAILERSSTAHTVRIEVQIDGTKFTSYVADAVLVSTPTGSTAYAFSARGPIVDPSHYAQILMPVSPHMLFDRALVLGPDTLVTLTVSGARDANLSVDGQMETTLRDGDLIRCRAADVDARLVVIGAPDFHSILRAKFGLAER